MLVEVELSFGAASRRHLKAPTRTYALRDCGEADTPDTVTRTFSILNSFIYTLLDLGSTLSYASSDILENKG